MTSEPTVPAPVNISVLFDRAHDKANDFSELIKKIETAPEETRLLWREIYENALEDRVKAQLLFTDLYQHVSNNQHGHMNHGVLMTRYLERMNKANDQLLKLVELIDKAYQQDSQIDGEELYEEIAS